MVRGVFCAVLASVVGAFSVGVVEAAESSYPERPIRLVVPFTVGGGSDAAARYFSEKLTSVLGQSVIVENRPGGASGSIGVLYVKNAPADGYTVLVGSSSPLVINPLAVKDMHYDPVKDFKPVHGLTKNTTAIVVSNESRYKTLGELIEASKNNQHFNAGTASAGFQLAANWFGEVGGFKFTHINYKGLNQVLTDVTSQVLDWAIVDLAGATPMIQGGRLRALAVTDERRHPRFPDVPTVVESGYPSYVYNTWTSFHVRSETPGHVVTKLAAAIDNVIRSDDAKRYAADAGTELLPLGPEAFEQYQSEEFERFSRVAKSSGYEPR